MASSMKEHYKYQQTGKAVDEEIHDMRKGRFHDINAKEQRANDYGTTYRHAELADKRTQGGTKHHLIENGERDEGVDG